MLDPLDVPGLEENESLARYVYARNYINKQTGMLKHNAFMPPRDRELSVTRHRSTSESEIWTVGLSIGDITGRELQGRGDVLAKSFHSQKLTALADPIPDNPNHAKVVGWPENKDQQKLIAKEIAAVATLSCYADELGHG